MRKATFLILAFSVVAACGDDSTSNTHDLGVNGGGGGSGATDQGTRGADGFAPSVSQGDLAAILDALNSGEVMQAQAAQARGLTVTDVASFAATMISVHGDAKTRQDALFMQLGITPTPNAIVTQLMTSSQHTIAVLQGLSGRALDQGYVDSQVAAHQDALDKIDYVLLPSAEATALKTELTNTRATVAMHLQMALALQTALLGLDS